MTYRLKRGRNGSLFGWLGAAAVLGLLLGSMSPTTAAAATGPVISLMIDGKGVPTEVSPTVKNQRMLVPIRAIAEHTGVSVYYTSQTRRITLKGNGHQAAVFVGSRTGYLDGKRAELDAVPMIVRGRTLVPVRFVSEALGYEVTWDSQSRVAIIKTTPGIGQTGPSKTSRTLQHSYVVKPGDTLSHVAKLHGTTMGALKRYNRLQQEQLQIGQVLYLPPGATTSSRPLSAFLPETRLLAPGNTYPLPLSARTEPMQDTYGEGRLWGDQTAGRSHEGIDIMTELRAPVYAVTSGRINRIGWNTYGGWRINITDQHGKYRFYYAHLDAFVPAVKTGSWVNAGQLIGFAGTTGYGPPGTKGKFAPHLHFGMYRTSDGEAVNPFYYLRYWEQQRLYKL